VGERRIELAQDLFQFIVRRVEYLCSTIGYLVIYFIKHTHTYYGMSAESQQRQLMLGNSSANTAVARQWLSSR
jgi:hypothetical protein